MIQYSAQSGPHTHAGQSTPQLMYLVVAALLPATLFGFILFGFSAIKVWLLTTVSAMLFEMFALQLRGVKWQEAGDGSAILTGWLLAMSLPPASPWWICVLGSAFAVLVGKQLFGGLGQNPFNPAMLGRVMLLICFPVELTDWHSPAPPQLSPSGLQLSDAWLGIDATTAATPLSLLESWHQPLLNLAMGNQSGSLGETSSLLLIAGGLFLIWKRVINWHIPLSCLVGLALPALVAHLIAPQLYAGPLHHLFSGGAMLCAFFIATDMVTSPASQRGQLLFGCGCGLLIWIIRTFGSYPEGVAFAVLIMNATTPVIDYYLRPAIFGSRAGGAHG